MNDEQQKPTVTARRPISREEYIRTVEQTPDETSVIPAIPDEVVEVVEEQDSVAEVAEPVTQTPEPVVAEVAVETPAVPVVETTRVVEKVRTGGRVKRRISHIDPWSVTKMSFVVSVALMVVMTVAAVVFWFVLQVTGVWDAVNDSVTNVLSDGSAQFRVTDYFGLARLTGFTLVVSALNVIFLTALATIGAHAYNLAASFMGGFSMTVDDRD